MTFGIQNMENLQNFPDGETIRNFIVENDKKYISESEAVYTIDTEYIQPTNEFL